MDLNELKERMGDCATLTDAQRMDDLLCGRHPDTLSDGEWQDLLDAAGRGPLTDACEAMEACGWTVPDALWNATVHGGASFADAVIHRFGMDTGGIPWSALRDWFSEFCEGIREPAERADWLRRTAEFWEEISVLPLSWDGGIDRAEYQDVKVLRESYWTVELSGHAGTGDTFLEALAAAHLEMMREIGISGRAYAVLVQGVRP